MIKTLFAKERPRERCLSQGPQSLSLRECFAVLLGSGPKGMGCLGLAQKLFEDPQQQTISDEAFFRLFENGLIPHMETIKGLGPAGKARILVSLEISRRYWVYKQSLKKRKPGSLKQQIRQRIPKEFRCSPKEQMGIIARLSSGPLSAFMLIGQGDDQNVSVSYRQLLQTLIYIKAESYWLFHNHPNNQVTPSPQDQEMTRNLKAVSRIMGIPLNGHWVVGWQTESLCDE